jgi:hypothetical protein
MKAGDELELQHLSHDEPDEHAVELEATSNRLRRRSFE